MAVALNGGMNVVFAAETDAVGEPTYAVRGVSGGPDRRGLTVDAAAEAVGDLERHDPTWILPSAEHDYRPLLDAGVRLRRCHDLMLVERLLLAHERRHAEPYLLPAAYARAVGAPVPPDVHPADDDQQALLPAHGSGLPSGVSVADAAVAVFETQERRLQAHDQRFRLLARAESACGLAGAEMSFNGLPWRADVHRRLLDEVLGSRVDGRPAALTALSERISAAFGYPVNPDHPASVVRAFGRAGIDVPSSRAHVLRGIDHPAVEPLLEYKELARLHSTHGWHWLSQWVSGGRFRPAFSVGAVVSGRWASRGGGALQIPRVLRRCVQADDGWTLVVADAAQLEPRVLAALAGDRALAQVSGSSDLYSGLADDAFDGDRSRAKVAMLSAMYGGTSGEAGALLAQLRRRFPVAVSYVEQAALAGERGEFVRSRLGRTSPLPSSQWQRATSGDGADARRAAREWGRFTRNFVVQASAADFTAVLLALLRRRLPADAQLVFFQHDEVIVHCPSDLAGTVSDLLERCADDTRRLVFGDACQVQFPLPAAVVDCYA